MKKEKLMGVLLGTAVGDAIALPVEGLSPKRIKRFYSDEQISHRLLFNKGMVSDDTEHTLMIAESILFNPDSPKYFGKCFAKKLKLWILGLPAGIGFATLKASLKLLFGFSYKKSGVFSAGNGPAMRSGIIGATFYDSSSKIDEYVNVSTQITHTDPKAHIGANAIAHLVAFNITKEFAPKPEIDEIFRILRKVNFTDDSEWETIVSKLSNAYEENKTLEDLIKIFGLEKGITGYVYHTVPLAVYSWLINWGDFEKTIQSLIMCGGDTDTVCSIAGALSGSLVDEKGIPEDWIKNICDWPKGISYIRKIGNELYRLKSKEPYESIVKYFWPGLIIRNLLFLILVLFHGFRRIVYP